MLEPIELQADDGLVKFTLTPPSSSPSVVSALINNTEFTDEAFAETNGKMIPFGSIGIAANKKFKINGIDFMDFTLGGSSFAGCGVFRSKEELFKTLENEGLNEPMVRDLNFADLDRKNLFALRWGYGAEGAVNGKLPNVAFGIGLTFGASGRKGGLYALIRSFDRQSPAFDALSQTVQSWKTPRQINSPDDLNPGTWLIVETDGEIKFNLGAKFGYQYSWVRNEVKIGALNGDLGLKIEAAVSAKFGFHASGRYALVISRENDARALRLKVFKLNQSGWSFAFKAAASGQLTEIPAKEKLYDLLKAVFNLNGQQVLKDIEKWLDPDADLAELIGDEGIDSLFRLIEKMTGVTPTDIDEAIEKLRQPVERWRALPHEISSVLYEMLREALPLDDLRGFLKDVVRLSDEDGLEEELRELIGEHLEDIRFYQQPVGRWLTAYANQGILSLLANVSSERARLHDYARRTLDLLREETISNALQQLQTWIEEKLNLRKILDVATQADFDQLDGWLKRRLADFLNKNADDLGLDEVKKIRDAINAMLDRAEEFYAMGYASLTEKYQAEFNYTFQKTTNRTALIDLTFDFEANAENAEIFLEKALEGDFYELFSSPEPIDGVRVNKGVMTHEIKRNTHLEVDLPYFNHTLDHISQSVASGELLEQSEGRLWIFSLSAFDIVKKNDSLSKLSVTVKLTKDLGARIFSESERLYSYQLRLVEEKADSEDLKKGLKYLSQQYLKTQFSNGRNFDDYLAALDKALDTAGISGDNRFGNVLASFSVALPGEVLTAWEKAPAEKSDSKYFSISRRVQEILRLWIPQIYVYELDRYRNTEMVYPLLVYSALDPIYKIRYSNNQLSIFPPNPQFNRDIYNWDYEHVETRSAVMRHYAQRNLPRVLERVREELRSMPGTQELYSGSEGNIKEIIRVAQRNPLFTFVPLVRRENRIIKGVLETAANYRAFLQARRMEEAIKELAEFGASITDTFNEDFGQAYAGPVLRPLSSLLLLEIVGIFDPELAARVKPTAMLELSILKPDKPLRAEEYLTGKYNPTGGDTVVQQRIVSMG